MTGHFAIAAELSQHSMHDCREMAPKNRRPVDIKATFGVAVSQALSVAITLAIIFR